MTGMGEEPRRESEADLVVFRCRDCGDTFPAHPGDDLWCPTCKGTNVHEAHEPLL